MVAQKGSSREPSSEGKLSDMWQCNGVNSWTYAGKAVPGTSFQGAGGFYTEEDLKVGESI